MILERCLTLFVNECNGLYGASMIVSNVHSLIHLADDCDRHGVLDSFSGFKYENNMSNIKRMLRSKNLPLQQVVNRHLDSIVDVSIKNNVSVKTKRGTREHFEGPTMDYVVCQQYRTLMVEDCVKFSINGSDSFFMDTSNKYYQVVNILSTTDGFVFICKTFVVNSSFYSYPVSSKKIGIVTVSGMDDALCCVELSRVYRKCILVPSQRALLPLSTIYPLS